MSQTFQIKPAGQQSILNLAELWQFRYLFASLVSRTIRVRYQQTIIGGGWTLVQPLLLTLLFTIIFGRLANMPTNGQPYPIFVLSGLIVWLFVAQSFSSGVASMVGNAHLITRIYFPRVILIMTVLAATLVEFLGALVLLILMMIWYGVVPSIGALAFIPMMGLAVMTVFGLSLWLSAMNVHYRDIGHVLPFLVQIWMFSSPVIYPSNLLPEKYQFLYAINPLVVVIDTSRWAFAGGMPPQGGMVLVSFIAALVLCVTGFWFFRRMESTFADIV